MDKMPVGELRLSVTEDFNTKMQRLITKRALLQRDYIIENNHFDVHDFDANQGAVVNAEIEALRAKYIVWCTKKEALENKMAVVEREVMRENKGALNMVKYQAELIRTGIKAEWDELMAETL